MFGIKKFLVLLVLGIFDHTESLVQLPSVEENDILKTETSIRTTVNNLFSLLQLRDTQERSRIKQYTVVHNYFVSLTVQDYSTLKTIAQLTRVDKNTIQNITTFFIALINEIIDEENVLEIENTTKSDIERLNYLQDELQKFQHLKTSYADPKKYVDVDTEVLRILESSNINDEVINATTESASTKDVFLNSSSSPAAVESDTWDPPEDPVKDGRRIFAGDRAKVKDFPFMASIEIFNKFQCGASIIEKDLLITAASCLQLAWNNRFYRENPVFLSVRVGSDYYEIGGEVIPVLEIYFYPSYVPRTLENNIAVMRIVRHINFRKKKRVKKITLDENDHALPYNTPGVLVLGWGAYTSSNVLHSPLETKLRKSILPVYGINDCADIYSKQYVTRKNFCAGMISKGLGACNRDAGGPGVVGKHLVGVISFGSPLCGTPDSPTVFTKVGFYFDWIEEIIDQYVPQHKQRTTTKHPHYHLTETERPLWYITPLTPSKKFMADSLPTTEDVFQTTYNYNYNIKNTTSPIPQSQITRNKHLARTTHILKMKNEQTKHHKLKKVNSSKHKKKRKQGLKIPQGKVNREQNFKSFLKTIFHDEDEIEKYLEAIKKPSLISQISISEYEGSNEERLYTRLNKKSFNSETLSGIRPITTTEVTTQYQTMGMLQIMNASTDVGRPTRNVITKNAFIPILEPQMQIQEQDMPGNVGTTSLIQRIEKLDQQIEKILDESGYTSSEEEALSIPWNTPNQRMNLNNSQLLNETITNVTPTAKEDLQLFSFNNFMLNQRIPVPSTNDVNTRNIRKKDKHATRKNKELRKTRPSKVQQNTQKQQKYRWTPSNQFYKNNIYNYYQSTFIPYQSQISSYFPINNNTFSSQTWYQWSTINNFYSKTNTSEVTLAQQGKSSLSLEHQQLEKDLMYVINKFRYMATTPTTTEDVSKRFNIIKHYKKSTQPTIFQSKITSKPRSFGDEVKLNMEIQLARLFKKEEMPRISNIKSNLAKLSKTAKTNNYNTIESSGELSTNDERRENQGSVTSARISEVILIEEHTTTTPSTINSFSYTQPTVLNLKGNEVNQNMDIPLAKFFEHKDFFLNHLGGDLSTLSSSSIPTSYDDIESSSEKYSFMNNGAVRQKEILESMTSTSTTNVKWHKPIKSSQFTVPSTMKTTKDHALERHLAKIIFMNMHGLSQIFNTKKNTSPSFLITANNNVTTVSPYDMSRVPEVKGSTFKRFWQTNDYFHTTESPYEPLLGSQTKDSTTLTFSPTQVFTYTEQPLLEGLTGDELKDVSENQENNEDPFDSWSVLNLSKEHDTLETYKKRYFVQFNKYYTKNVENTSAPISSSENINQSTNSKPKNYIPKKYLRKNLSRHHQIYTSTPVSTPEFSKPPTAKKVYKKKQSKYITRKWSSVPVRPTFTYFTEKPYLKTLKYTPGVTIIEDNLNIYKSTSNPTTDPITKIIIEIPYTITQKIVPKVPSGSSFQPTQEINLMNLSYEDKLHRLAKIVEAMIKKSNPK